MTGLCFRESISPTGGKEKPNDLVQPPSPSQGDGHQHNAIPKDIGGSWRTYLRSPSPFPSAANTRPRYPPMKKENWEYLFFAAEGTLFFQPDDTAEESPTLSSAWR